MYLAFSLSPSDSRYDGHRFLSLLTFLDIRRRIFHELNIHDTVRLFVANASNTAPHPGHRNFRDVSESPLFPTP